MSFPKGASLTAQMQVTLDGLSAKYVVYLLHFSNPIQKKTGECSHYLGLTKDITKRLKTHAKGQGNGLVKAAFDRGEVVLVELWAQDGNFEQKLKRRKKARHLCRICRQKDGLKPQFKFNEVNNAQTAENGRSLAETIEF